MSDSKNMVVEDDHDISWAKPKKRRYEILTKNQFAVLENEKTKNTNTNCTTNPNPTEDPEPKPPHSMLRKFQTYLG